MTKLACTLRGFCLPRVIAFAAFLLIWLLQPVMAQTKFTFGDRVPSFHGGYFLDGMPKEYFSDTGEPRFQKAGRVAIETIGGPAAWGKEFADIGLFPFREPVVFGAAALGIGTLVYFDYPLTRFYQDNIEPAFDWFTPAPIIPRSQTVLPILNRISYEDQYMLLGMGLTYGYGLAFNDERAQVAALLSAKAVAYSYATTQVLLKPVFGRLRPEAHLSGGETANPDFTTDPWRFGQSPGIQFGPERRGTAFPSFHYTQYFAVARVYSGVYDNSWIPYAVAGLAAVSNIRGHRHWVGDMAAGAVVGTVIGQTIINNYAERRGLGMTVMPVVSTSGVGAQFSMSF